MKKLPALLSALLIRGIGMTLRVRIDDRGGVVNHPDHAPAIMAFWHNRLFLMAFFFQRYCRGRTTLALISRSRDGQFISDVAAQFGVRAARGSSSRHGTAAALTAVREADNPRVDISITPDGPRGPRYHIQPGLLRLAQATGRPIVTVTYRLGWKVVARSWDRFQIPLPFSTCELITGSPVTVSKDATETELAAIVAQITKSLGGD